MKAVHFPVWLLTICMMAAALAPERALAQNRLGHFPEARVNAGYYPPLPQGSIKIGTPQVYSRQLVFRDRAEEIQYLSARLKETTKYTPNFQGIVDARTYQGLGLQMALAFNPGAGKVEDQARLNQLLVLEQQTQQNALAAEVKKKNLEIELETAKQALEALKKKESAPPAGGTVELDAATKTQIDDLETQMTEANKKLEELSAKDPPTVQPESNRVKPGADKDPKEPSPALTSGGQEAQKTTAVLTQIEQEKAVLEVRRFLQNERRRLSFDDLHDGAGAVAVDLGMLVTLIPPKDRDAYAVVEAHVQEMKLCECPQREEIVKALAQTLMHSLAYERHFIEERFAALALPIGERYFDMALRQLQQEKLAADAASQTVNQASQAPKPRGAGTPPEPNVPQPSLDRQSMFSGMSALSTNELTAKFWNEKKQRSMTGADAGRQAHADRSSPSVQAVIPPSLELPPSADPAQVTGGEVEKSAEAEFMEATIVSIIPQQVLVQDVEYMSSRGVSLLLQNKYQEKLINRYMQIYWTEEFGRFTLRGLGGGRGLGSSGKEVVYEAPGQNAPTYVYAGGVAANTGGRVVKLKDGPLDLSLDDLKLVAENAINLLDSQEYSSRVRVLSVDPADQGQNISNVGASQTVTDITMAVSAALAQGASGSGRLDAYTENRLYLQSANRKPLAVGFVNGGGVAPSFGWVLGPRFEMQMKRSFPLFWSKKPEPGFTHEPTQHQVQVSIGMNAWTPALQIYTRSWWVDKRTGRPATPISTTECMPVKLLPDYVAMTEGFLDLMRGRRRPPRILIGKRSEEFLISSKSNTEHVLTLLGKDMWRSPAVYLDSLPATTVEVMPGLVGVVATFKGELPASNDEMYDVTVSTTDGFDVIYNRAAVPTAPDTTPMPDPGEQGPGFSVGLVTDVVKHAFGKNGELRIPLKILENRYPMPPQTYLKASGFPTGRFNDQKTGTLAADGAGLSLILGEADKPLTAVIPGLGSFLAAKPASTLLSMTITIPVMNVEAGIPDLKDVVKGGRNVLVVDPEQCRFTVPSELKYTLGEAVQEVHVRFPDAVLPEHFKRAYPELVKAAQEGSITLELTDADAATRVYAKLPMKSSTDDVSQGLYFDLPARADLVAADKLPLDDSDDAKRKRDCFLRLNFGREAPEKVSGKVSLEVPKKAAQS